eukprot:126349-Pleurochrysis_carterae.AAC.2
MILEPNVWHMWMGWHVTFPLIFRRRQAFPLAQSSNLPDYSITGLKPDVEITRYAFLGHT